MRKTTTGAYQYEITPGVWVSRQRVHQLAHPNRHAARTAVTAALESGELRRQPCEICGEPDTQAHHDDYALPLVVRWLCGEHHRATGPSHRRYDKGRVIGASLPVSVDHKFNVGDFVEALNIHRLPSEKQVIGRGRIERITELNGKPIYWVAGTLAGQQECALRKQKRA